MKGIALAASCSLIVVLCLFRDRRSPRYSELEQEESSPAGRSHLLALHIQGHKQRQQDAMRLNSVQDPPNSNRLPLHHYGHKQRQQDSMQLTFEQNPANSNLLPLHKYGHKQREQDSMQLTFEEDPPHSHRLALHRQGHKQPQQDSMQLSLDTTQAPNKKLQAIEDKLVASRQRLAEDNLKLKVFKGYAVAKQKRLERIIKQGQTSNQNQPRDAVGKNMRKSQANRGREASLQRMYRKFREKQDDHNNSDEDDDHDGQDDSNTNAHHEYDDDGNDIDGHGDTPEPPSQKPVQTHTTNKDPELEKIRTGGSYLKKMYRKFREKQDDHNSSDDDDDDHDGQDDSNTNAHHEYDDDGNDIDGHDDSPGSPEKKTSIQTQPVAQATNQDPEIEKIRNGGSFLKKMYRKFREKQDDHNSSDDDDDDHGGKDDSSTNAHHEYDDDGNDIHAHDDADIGASAGEFDIQFCKKHYVNFVDGVNHKCVHVWTYLASLIFSPQER
jgi:hypothetical protein